MIWVVNVNNATSSKAKALESVSHFFDRTPFVGGHVNVLKALSG
jgi:hypothetical protein